MANELLPSINELRASQKKGREDEGLNETDCRELNATQGHKVDIRDYPGADQACEAVQRGMMDGNASGNLTKLDRTDRGSWPDAEKI